MESERPFALPLRLRLLIAGALLVVSQAGYGSCPSVPYTDPPDSSQPANLGALKRQLLNYKCFGEYDRQFAAVIAEARRYVEARAKAPLKAALVLDIDETSLSNWQQMDADDFGYIPDGPCSALPSGPCGANAWYQMAKAPALSSTLDLFNFAKSAGVSVFFVTGRTCRNPTTAASASGYPSCAEVMQMTESNLRYAGYDGWARLYIRVSGQQPTVRDYKTAMRADIEAQGYTIVANVGDQWSDLDGGHAERVFKAPNPFYYIP